MVCGVPKALLPKGKGRDVLLMGIPKLEGYMSIRTLCVVCCTPGLGGSFSPRQWGSQFRVALWGPLAARPVGAVHAVFTPLCPLVPFGL